MKKQINSLFRWDCPACRQSSGLGAELRHQKMLTSTRTVMQGPGTSEMGRTSASTCAPRSPRIISRRFTTRSATSSSSSTTSTSAFSTKTQPTLASTRVEFLNFYIDTFEKSFPLEYNTQRRLLHWLSQTIMLWKI